MHRNVLQLVPDARADLVPRADDLVRADRVRRADERADGIYSADDDGRANAAADPLHGVGIRRVGLGLDVYANSGPDARTNTRADACTDPCTNTCANTRADALRSCAVQRQAVHHSKRTLIAGSIAERLCRTWTLERPAKCIWHVCRLHALRCWVPQEVRK